MSYELSFNDFFRKKTKEFAINIIKYSAKLPRTDEIRVVKNQLLRSATSIAANFRAACRARSDAEYYAKMCIVVEEADESVFWLEILEEANLHSSTLLIELKNEANQIISIAAKTRKTLKSTKNT
ncbi:MAG: four helix bundle protein [Runella sp.]